MADPVEPPQSKVVDLMAALEASVAAAKEARERRAKPVCSDCGGTGLCRCDPLCETPCAGCAVPSTDPPSDERLTRLREDVWSVIASLDRHGDRVVAADNLRRALAKLTPREYAVPSLPVTDPPDELAVESGGGTARRARLAMLHDLERVVAMCGCSWPVTVYRSGDGHHPECPAHKPLVRPTRGTKADGR